MEGKEAKWDLGDAIDAGNESLTLIETYLDDIQLRLRTDEMLKHTANVKELEIRRAGQKQTLVDQKSKTAGQNTLITILNTIIVDLRNIIKSSNASEEILEAYGVGEKISLTKSGVTAAANIVLDGYKKFPEWSKDAGILTEDITKVSGVITSLVDAGKVQKDSMYTRKAKTMDKDVLQREVEDEVTRLSALGAYIFRETNPAVARLFENLIPSSPSQKEKTEKKTEDSPK